jgi:hypothetical protein
MTTELPIACSLTAAEMPGRLAEMADLGRSALLSVERDDTRAVLRFRADAEICERLAAIVAAEAKCCAFLDMTLTDEHDALVLKISAPADARPILDELVAGFAAPAPTP